MLCLFLMKVKDPLLFTSRSRYSSYIGISAETIQAAIAELANNGFDCYQTSLGGVGVSASVLADSEDETWMDSADRRTLESHVV